jgi:hypothetical protein
MSNFSFSDTDQALWLFHYDANGVFIGSGLTVIPAGTGLPANTTTLTCTPPEGQTGIWDGSIWNYVEDKRGMRYWNKYGVGSVVLSVNESVPDDAIFSAPPPKETGYVFLFTGEIWLRLKDMTGEKYYGNLGQVNIVPDAYFSLPEGCTFIPPIDPKTGYVTQFNGEEWVYVEDHRGKTVYQKSSGIPVVIDYIGPIKNEQTEQAPVTAYDEWDGQNWVTNEEAKKSALVTAATKTRYSLRMEADSEISVLLDAQKLGLATANETSLLEKWQLYRIELMRIDPALAPEITWPVKP